MTDQPAKDRPAVGAPKTSSKAGYAVEMRPKGRRGCLRLASKVVSAGLSAQAPFETWFKDA